jgi:hypothetical protein
MAQQVRGGVGTKALKMPARARSETVPTDRKTTITHLPARGHPAAAAALRGLRGVAVTRSRIVPAPHTGMPCGPCLI